MDTKVNYAGITRRVGACVVDFLIFGLIFDLFLSLVLNKSLCASFADDNLFDVFFS